MVDDTIGKCVDKGSSSLLGSEVGVTDCWRVGSELELVVGDIVGGVDGWKGFRVGA